MRFLIFPSYRLLDFDYSGGEYDVQYTLGRTRWFQHLQFWLFGRGEQVLKVRGAHTVWSFTNGRRCGTDLEYWLSEQYQRDEWEGHF